MGKGCCFTGHVMIPTDYKEVLLKRLDERVKFLIENESVSDFYVGGAVGFDTFAAEYLINLKNKYPFIKVHLLIPYKNWDDEWSESDRRRAKFVEEYSDTLVYISDKPDKAAFNERNRALVDNSDYCIAYFCGAVGGTKYTVDYAVSKNIEVFNLGNIQV